MKRDSVDHILLWGGIPVLGVAGSLGCSLSLLGQSPRVDLAIGSLVAACIGIVWIVFFTRPGQHNKKLLEKLLPAILRVIDIANDGVRVCIYVPDGKDHLKQITNYQPTGTASTFARLPNRAGIIGQAFTTKNVQFDYYSVLTTNDEYRQSLQSRWGFSPEEAARVDLTRRGFLAVPILRNNELCGIIYCDSQDPRVIEELDPDLLVERASAASVLLEPLV